MTELIPDAVFSVSEYIEFANALLGQAVVTIRGEVTSISDRGHLYFSLTDATEQAVLSCALWKSVRSRLPFAVEAGMEIEVVGHANVYAPSGRFTFIVESAAPVGEGALRAAYAKLKAKLEAAGYFLPDRKRPLPRYPQRVGLLTSAQGEALHDFRKHLAPVGLTVLHRDCRVEGLGAVGSIVRGLRWFNEQADPVELIVLTRGGGSLESLQAYNSFEVAEAVFASRIPVLSAVGHERDESIADYVADARASTPTHAGRLLSQYWGEAPATIAHIWSFLVRSLQRNTAGYAQQLLLQAQQRRERWQHHFVRAANRVQLAQSVLDHSRRRPQEQYERGKQMLRHAHARWHWAQAAQWERVQHATRMLAQADPQHRLRQGYSIVRRPDGTLARDLVAAGDQLAIEMARQHVFVTTQTVQRKEA